MQDSRHLHLVEPVTSFELKASSDSPGMANLRINCVVSIPTGIRILALIDAEETKPEERDDGNAAAAGEKAARGRKRRPEAEV